MPSGRSNLENLVRARQLNAESPDEREIANLLVTAERLTAGASAQLAAALGYYHDRRNKIEYEGSVPSGTEAKDLIELAAQLQALLRKRLKPRK